MSAAPSLNGFLSLLQTSGFNDPNAPGVQAALQAVRYYDPGASVVNVAGSDSAPNYQFNFDASKLPGMNGGLLAPNQTSTDATQGGAQAGPGYAPHFTAIPGGNTSNLINPNATTNTQNYGTVTDLSNIKAQKPTLLNYIGDAWSAAMGLYGLGAASGLIPGGATAAGAGAGMTPAAAAGITPETLAPVAGPAALGPGIDTSLTLGGAGAAAGGITPAAAAGISPETLAPVAGANTLGDAQIAAPIGDATGAVTAGIGGGSNFISGPVETALLNAGVPASVITGAAGLLSTASHAISGVNAANNLLNGGSGTGAGTGTGGGGGGGGLLSTGGGTVPDSMAMLRAYFAPKTAAHMSQMQVATNPMMAQLQQPGGLQGLLGLLSQSQGGGYG